MRTGIQLEVADNEPEGGSCFCCQVEEVEEEEEEEGRVRMEMIIYQETCDKESKAYSFLSKQQ